MNCQNILSRIKRTCRVGILAHQIAGNLKKIRLLAFLLFVLTVWMVKEPLSKHYGFYIAIGDCLPHKVYFFNKNKTSDLTLFLCYNYTEIVNDCNKLLLFSLLKHLDKSSFYQGNFLGKCYEINGNQD